MWFKTNDNIKRNTGNLVSIFGWKFDVLTGKNNYVVLPENFPDRMYMNGFRSFRELEYGWGEYDVYI